MNEVLHLIDYAVAVLPLPGQALTGDCQVIRPFPDGVLVAVMDGLGHGEEAAAVARTAAAILEDHADEAPIPLMKLCHEGLKKTRGVVMSLASFNARDETMTWLGVGNVDGVLLRADAQGDPARESLLLHGGVVGYQLPPLRPSLLHLRENDLLIFVTDGIRSAFIGEVVLRDGPQQIADYILSRHAKGTDDALALVARWKGNG